MALYLLLGLLSWPSFLCGVGAVYWCFQLSAITTLLKFWRARNRNDVESVLKFLNAYFGFKVVKVGDEKLYSGKCMYLANHRSWADFFVDMWVIEARAVPLGRYAVGAAFPAFASSLLPLRAILLFNRSGVKDIEKFNSWLDGAVSGAHAPSLLVYPEGHRSLSSASLPLKRGMLRYAFSRKLPIQVSITAHKEEVLNEKGHSMHFGRTLVTGLSEVVQTSQFDDFEEFMVKVQATWDSQWVRVHAAPREGLPVVRPSFPHVVYTPRQLAIQSFSLAFWLLLLLGMLGLWVKACMAVAGMGFLGAWAVRGAGVYTAASFLVSFMPPIVSSKKRLEAKKQS